MRNRLSQETQKANVNKGIKLNALMSFKHDYTYKISVNWDNLSKIVMMKRIFRINNISSIKQKILINTVLKIKGHFKTNHVKSLA